MKKFNFLTKTRWVVTIIVLITLGVVQVWAVDPVEEYIFEEAGGTTVSEWTFTNGTTTNDINQSGYWLLDAGSTKDYIITSAYDLSAYDGATVYADIQSYGSGTHNALKIEISYNGGSTWAQNSTYTTTTSNATKSLSLSSTLTNNIKIRLSNTGSSGRGVRVKNFKLQITYTPVNHTVNWYVNNPSTPAHTQTALQGTTLTGIPTPTSSDCDKSKQFVGWTETPDYSDASDAPSDLITNTTGMTMPKTDKDYYAVFADVVGGTITVTAANCAAGASGSTYAEKVWTTTSTDGDDYSGIFKIYGNSSSASMQFNNGQTPCFYNTTEFSAPITNITMTYASGTTRTWTPRLSSSTMQNSSSASNGTNLTGKSVSETTTWDVDIEEDYRWVYLGVGGGASYISSIEITYGIKTNYTTSCCEQLGAVNGPVTLTKTAFTITATWLTTSGGHETGYKVQLYDNNGTGVKGSPIGDPVEITAANRTCTFGAKTPVGNRLTHNHEYFVGVTPTNDEGGDYCEEGTEVTASTTTNQAYTVTYAAGTGGSGTMTDTNSPYETGDEVTVLANAFYKNGFSWTSWTYSPAQSVTDGKFTMGSANVTITANWTSNTDRFKDYMHGNTISNKSGNYGTMPTALSDEDPGSGCTGEHYKFMGWIEESGLGSDGKPNGTKPIIPAGESGHYATNTTYYAVWAAENE